jgi:hypothetical protein
MKNSTGISIFIAVVGLAGCGEPPDAVEETSGALTTSPEYVRSSAGDCPNSTPGPEEVYVYKNGNYAAPCKVLIPGFYPDYPNTGLDNDSISSLKVGSSVRVKAFRDARYASTSITFLALSSIPDLTAYGFNDAISSLRVEDASRSTTCSDYTPLEWKLSNSNDCVVVTAGRSLANESEMGIRNDSLTSLITLRGTEAKIYTDANFGHLCWIAPFGSIPSTAAVTCDNRISSIGP